MVKTNFKIFFLGILAGVAIAFGSLAFILTKSAGSSILGSVAFSIGLLLVCFLGLNLYTGKIGFVFDKQEKFGVLLLLTYLGNIVGAVATGYLYYFAFKDMEGVMDVVHSTTGIRMIGEGDSWYRALIMSMFCGVFVFLAVYGYKKFTNPGMKVFAIIFCVFIFVVTGMEHTIANMVYFSFGNDWSWRALLNILITTAGNSLGSILTYAAVKVTGK